MRFRVRGWNGAEASPVRDLTGLLTRSAPAVAQPVVLVGHSMVGRAALRAAGHPLVTPVAAAPSLPPGEPVDQLTGVVLLAHASDDRVVRPADTWAYAERAGAVAEVAAIELRNGDHAMLRRARLWHAIAARFARLALRQPVSPGPVAGAFARAAAGQPRMVL